MHGDDPTSEHYVVPKTLELLKLNYEAPTQDNLAFWKLKDFFVRPPRSARRGGSRFPGSLAFAARRA